MSSSRFLRLQMRIYCSTGVISKAVWLCVPSPLSSCLFVLTASVVGRLMCRCAVLSVFRCAPMVCYYQLGRGTTAFSAVRESTRMQRKDLSMCSSSRPNLITLLGVTAPFRVKYSVSPKQSSRNFCKSSCQRLLHLRVQKRSFLRVAG